ncbi:uncharacterized protein LOC117150546 [Drosophila mauritiana]|uniref:Uncharacterized protein LOC117150546 n=1 Tax=Drosophila mauritiana TaxID=7226 RepID=A0A6P8LD86_DROMA|nr:uncharacterized protein LOC117150546 [Drosophila mauritiana]
MCILNILFIVLFNTMFKDVISIRSMLCRRVEVKIACVEKNTWVFDRNSQTCISVIPDQEPCGHFVSEKACKDLCLRTNQKYFWINEKRRIFK